jgi:hypothetical protein
LRPKDGWTRHAQHVRQHDSEAYSHGCCARARAYAGSVVYIIAVDVINGAGLQGPLRPKDGWTRHTQHVSQHDSEAYSHGCCARARAYAGSVVCIIAVDVINGGRPARAVETKGRVDTARAAREPA